jgi:hypothetical protein
MWRRRVRIVAVLGVLAVVGMGARADDARTPPPEDPDPGFLEFLGSVDRLAELNPEYLSQANPPRARYPTARVPPAPPPPPPPPPSPAGAKNNDQ